MRREKAKEKFLFSIFHFPFVIEWLAYTTMTGDK
jgi:hypothetical protein